MRMPASFRLFLMITTLWLCGSTTAGPLVTYHPPPGTRLDFSGYGPVGATAAATLEVHLIAFPGVRTQVSDCEISSASPGAAFAGFYDTLRIPDPLPGHGPLSGQCRMAATPTTARLSCRQSSSHGGTLQLSWELSCPAGSLGNVTQLPVARDAVWLLVLLAIAMFGCRRLPQG